MRNLLSRQLPFPLGAGAGRAWQQFEQARQEEQQQGWEQLQQAVEQQWEGRRRQEQGWQAQVGQGEASPEEEQEVTAGLSIFCCYLLFEAEHFEKFNRAAMCNSDALFRQDSATDRPSKDVRRGEEK